RIQCANNLKQITIANANCADTHEGIMPPGLGLYPNRMGSENNGEGGLFLHLLPYVEQDNLYSASILFGDDRNYDPNTVNLTTWGGWSPPVDVVTHKTYSQRHGTVVNTAVKVYRCPSDPTADMGWAKASTSYAYNGMVFGISYQWGWGMGAQRFPGAITDGSSNTIFVTERETLSYGVTRWTPDCGFNYWPDWGPAIASAEGGQPTGPASLLIVRPNPRRLT